MSGAVSGQSPEPQSPARGALGSPPPTHTAGQAHVRRKYRAAAILFGLGLVLTISAWLAYPAPETGIPTPAYPDITITISQPVSSIAYSVVQARSGLVMLKISVTVYQGRNPAGSVQQQTVNVALPLGTAFQDLPLPPSYIQTMSKTLDFNSGFFDTTATVVFPLTAHSFGSDTNGVTAYAALPDVSYQLTTSSRGPAPPILYSQYQITSPNSYDWSTFPPESSDSSSATWEEFLTSTTNGEVAGRVVPGIDHARQSSDATWTFIAGALLGLAGGAILSAVQELLHLEPTPARAAS
jgi:hypothetical protein